MTVIIRRYPHVCCPLGVSSHKITLDLLQGQIQIRSDGGINIAGNGGAVRADPRLLVGRVDDVDEVEGGALDGVWVG